MDEFTKPALARSASPSQGMPAQWLAQAADALAAPLALLTAQGDLVYSNVAFQTLLADPAGPLRLQAGRVQPAVAAAAKAFAAGLAQAALGQAAALQVKVHGLDGGLTLLAGAAPDPLPKEHATWLVLTLKASSVKPVGANELMMYAAHFGLSAAETRVLKGVAAGANAAQVARRFGLKLATVRDHLLSIRRKTGHANQQALLMELARLPPLL